MKSVTWENIGVDRMACAWLIRRSIDAKATFTFVPEGQTPPAKAGEPFDIPGVRLSHHRGHCLFHAFLREYKLNDPVLQRIARIVDEADTVQQALVEPVAAHALIEPGAASRELQARAHQWWPTESATRFATRAAKLMRVS